MPGFLFPDPDEGGNINMHNLIAGTVLGDLFCGSVHVLGKYLDGDFNKSNANQEKNSCKEKGESKNDGNNGNNNSKGIGNNNLKSVKS